MRTAAQIMLPVSVDSRRAVLVGGISDVRTDASGYPNLRLEIVQLTNTLPGVVFV